MANPPEIKAVKGRRIYTNAEGHLPLAEGDYGRERDGSWSVRPPGQHAGGIPDHQVEEHEDGTITVTPSIRLLDDAGVELWHGYLTKGVWIA